VVVYVVVVAVVVVTTSYHSSRPTPELFQHSHPQHHLRTAAPSIPDELQHVHNK
jgi:hypothetical protein